MTSTKKRMSGSILKKNNVPTGSHLSDGCHVNERPQNVASSHGKDHTRTPQGYVHGGPRANGPNSLVKNSKKSAAYDAARISQWAEDSAAGPELSDNGTDSQTCSSYGDEMALTTMTPALPGPFTFPQADAMHFQQQSASLYQPHGTDMSFYNASTASAEASFARMDIGRDLGLDFPIGYQSEQYLNTANGLGPFDSMEMHPSIAFTNAHELSMTAEWENQLMNGFSAANAMGASQSLDWSSPTVLTPSTSSLPSENSFLEQPLETPLSATMQDFNWSTVQPMALASEIETIPQMSLEEMQVRFGQNFADPESTLRPKQGFQRAPLSMDLWSTPETATQAYGLQTYPGVNMSRRSSEGENRNARDHPFYKAEPSKEDNLYHCPDPNNEGCTKAEKLKCNYDKHLDSHLKPYRCKSQGCAQAVFSSTACLLRHEREAHSMHGHGNKPHLCHFPDCERAAEDNGFPRRWNLFDHMKRVHDYDPSNKSNSPSPSSSSPPPQEPARKRRTPSPTEEGAKKRIRVSSQTTQSSAPVPRIVQRQPQPSPQPWNGLPLEQVRSGHVAQMEARLRTMDPTDPSALEQHTRDYAILQAIDQDMRKQRASQLAYKDSRL